jgi:hypothetical protein
MADRPKTTGNERDVESRRTDDEVDSFFAATFTVDGVLAYALDVVLTRGSRWTPRQRNSRATSLSAFLIAFSIVLAALTVISVPVIPRALVLLYLNCTWKCALVGTCNCQFMSKAESLEQSH